MLLEASGSAGVALLVVLVVALPVQCALGALVASGRRIPAAAALAAPIGLLIAGFLGTIGAFEEALDAVRASEDPAWTAFFALDDRARAMAALALGALGALACSVPVVAGAAWAARRNPSDAQIPRWKRASHVLAVVSGLAGAAISGLAAEVVRRDASTVGWELAVAPVAAVLLGIGASSAVSRRAVTGAVLVGAGGLFLGVAAAATAAVALSELALSPALGGFTEPFGLPTTVAARAEASAILAGFNVLAAAIVVVGHLPGLLLRDWRRADALHGLDVIVIGLSCMGVVGLAAWTEARRSALTHFAGDHSAAVLRAAEPVEAASVPLLQPMPPRVLVVESADPLDPTRVLARWVTQRDRGGLETLPLPDGLEGAGEGIQSGDGVLLPGTMSMIDVYLLLADARAGRVALVSCRPARARRAAISADPLQAAGRCGAFPLDLRVTEPPSSPRTFIVLKDGWIDDGGEVVRVDALTDLGGRDVLLRAQGDATLADVSAALARAAEARRVWLAWGVDIDGADIAVGVNPVRWGDG